MNAQHLTRERAKREIQELSLPEFFVDLFRGERTLRELGIAAPEQIFALKKVTRSYHLIPLFEYQNETYCCEEHPEGKRFIAFSLDDFDKTTVFGRSFQCLLAALFIEFWQDERNDVILPMLAEALEFDYFDELVHEIGEANKLPTAQYFEWRTRFCAGCAENEIALWQQAPKLPAVA
jgi:hypothetical protein